MGFQRLDPDRARRQRLLRGGTWSVVLLEAAILFVYWKPRAPTVVTGTGSIAATAVGSVCSVAYARANSDVELNFWPGGPGAGTGQLIPGTVDFAISAVPLTDKEMQETQEKILHFPTMVAGDAIVYNVPEIGGKPLRLTGTVLADIYLGKIEKWNDRRLRALNPGVTFTDRDLVVFRLPSESGDTAVLADYLSKVSAAWRSEAGKSASPKSLHGSLAANTAEAVADVRDTPGAIAYADIGCALGSKLPVAEVRNRDGRWQAPSIDALEAAARSSLTHAPSDLRISLTDAPGPESYPLASFSYVLVYEHQTDRAKGEALANFLNWIIHDGQKYATRMNYAPLPRRLVRRENRQLEEIGLPPLE